jgi:type IV fimbrial biogenesis protein FimT
MLKAHRRGRGMTIVEIMISLTVLGLLLMMALPSFTEVLQNYQLRGASEAMINGFQVARAAAIKRNLPVVITVAPPSAGWTVTEAASGTVVQSRSKDEGSPNAAVAITPGGATKVTFTPLGGVIANSDASATITQIDISNPAGGACQPTGAMRCLRVLVSGGGSVRMCDPAVAATTPPDPRAC